MDREEVAHSVALATALANLQPSGSRRHSYSTQTFADPAGSHYLLGVWELMQHSHIEQTLYPVEHLYKNWLKAIVRFSPLSIP
jgi:hypothetical protein